MSGTKKPVKRPMARMPPRMTAPTPSASTTCTARGSKPNTVWSALPTSWDCTPLPMPKAAKAAATAKKPPSTRPVRRQGRPRARKTIGPPSIVPRWSSTR